MTELYQTILMSLLKLKIVDFDDGDNIVYDILSHWYDSYYITRDLWNTYILNQNGDLELTEGIIDEDANNMVTVFNVSEWESVELKTLLIFLILEIW